MESTPREGGNGQDRVKERWYKLSESEARVKFWGDLVRLGVGNRELENIGENLHVQFRSKIMLGGGKERKLVEQGTSLKWKDEKHYLRELRTRLEEEKEGLSKEIGRGWKYRKIIKNIKRDVKVHKVREEKRLEYKNALIFDKEKFSQIPMLERKVKAVGKVTLSKEEEEILTLNPKFTIMDRLDSEGMEVESEMGMAKYRFHTLKEDEIMDDVMDENDGGDLDQERGAPKSKRRRLDQEEEKIMESMELIEAESRQVYDSVRNIFDYGKKRTTDLKENAEVKLPPPSSASAECSIALLKNRIMSAFRKYRDENCDKLGNQVSNLTASELKGLSTLKKRIKDGEIVPLKTDKSGKMTVMSMEDYLKMGLKKAEKDTEVTFEELLKVQKSINDTTRYWIRILNAGTNHGHSQRILESKLTNSCNVAPSYYMYKDHKAEGGYRQVVGGCNSNTLGLSNMLSDVLESVAGAITHPYAVISSEDMLARVEEANKKIHTLMNKNNPPEK